MRNSMIQHLGEGLVDSSMPLVMVGLSLAELFRWGEQATTMPVTSTRLGNAFHEPPAMFVIGEPTTPWR